MTQRNTQIVHRYLDELVKGGDFNDIPLRDDVSFVGPLASADRADELRTICALFADSVDGISVRTMVELIIDSTPLRSPANSSRTKNS